MTLDISSTEELSSPSAEAAVLGSMIIDSSVIGDVMDIVTRDDMVDEAHRIIWDAIIAVWSVSKGVDGLLVRDYLEREKLMEQIGGTSYLAKVLESVPSAANAKYYAGIVAERTRYRKLVAAVEEQVKTLKQPGPVDERTEKIQTIALGVPVGQSHIPYATFKDHLTEATIKALDKQHRVSTGYKALDGYLGGGLVQGWLTIVAARPAMGKSALALEMAMRMGEAGNGVIFFPLEMTSEDLMERGVSSYAKMSLAYLRDNPKESEQRTPAMWRAVEAMKQWPITLNPTADTPEKQLAFVRSWSGREPVSVVIVDYLQLMRCGRKVEGRAQEVSAITRALKMMAMREKVAVIAVSQLNRAVEGREDHRPRMSDLRESGSIEQDADVVMLLHREDYYRQQEDPFTDKIDGLAEVIIAKNRRGPVGVAKLAFIQETTSFKDLGE